LTPFVVGRYAGIVGPETIRFTPARTYLTVAAVALGLAVFSAWCARGWLPAAVPAALFLASALFILWLGLRPAIEVDDAGLKTGHLYIAWSDVRRVDQTGWVSPMVADLTLADRSRVRLIYPGETRQSNHLLRIIQQRSTAALINGVPYRQLFGDPVRAGASNTPPPPPTDFRVLTEADEAEVERLYQKLRAAGRLDPEK